MDIQTLSEEIVKEVEVPTGPGLPNEILIDKILGLIYGNALGDALGVRTEFLSSHDAKNIWHGQEFSLLDWTENRRFPIADWTDDTDQMILILQGFLETSTINPLDFAKKLREWQLHGFPEFGDAVGMGIGFTVSRVLSSKNFLAQPSQASVKVWAKHKCDLAANGALMRTSILGVVNFQNITQVIVQTLEIAMVTHADPRSVAACVAETTAIALMLQGVSTDLAISTSKQLARVFIEKYTQSLQVLIEKNCENPVKENFIANKPNFSRELLDKYLDIEFENLLPIDGDDLGYAYICLACAFWAVKQEDWVEAIGKIILEGGDADTNGAAAGAILGCKLGFNKLPQFLVSQLRHKDWLEIQISALLKTLKVLE